MTVEGSEPAKVTPQTDHLLPNATKSFSPSKSFNKSLTKSFGVVPDPDRKSGYRRQITAPAVNRTAEESFQDSHLTWFVTITVYLGYGVLIGMGYFREIFRNLLPGSKAKTPEGYAPLTKDWNDFYTRRLYTRIRDCWNRPINTRPGRVFGVMERESDDHNVSFKWKKNADGGYATKVCINLSSYNYLGFANNPTVVNESVKESVRKFGTGSCSPAFELGTTAPMYELEQLTAEFVGKEAAMVIGMGYATNSATIPALAPKGSLIISDCLNHTSLVSGARGSEAVIRVFQHNRFDQLEQMIRKAIWQGQPRTHRPWRRIIIVVEGIYSMEGEILDLATVVRIKKKYRCELYVDEAHSIGALGATGRGICEACYVDPCDVDVLMGTYTKSFGSIGGYIAGTKRVIDRLRPATGGSTCAFGMCAPACEQALCALKVIMNRLCPGEGERRLARIRHNAKRLRDGLHSLNLTVYGDDDSPVIPTLLYNPAKMPSFSRECLARGVAVVVVGYPATPLLEGRVRFCVSSAHTDEDIDRVIDVVREVSNITMIKYKKSATGF